MGYSAYVLELVVVVVIILLSFIGTLWWFYMQYEIRVHKQKKILYRVINDRPLNNMYGGKINLR